MLDQIARQMIEFYKDFVTQRMMDQRILQELYNFKNVIEELTRWKPWGSSTQSGSQSPVFTWSERKPWGGDVKEEGSFAFRELETGGEAETRLPIWIENQNCACVW